MSEITGSAIALVVGDEVVAADDWASRIGGAWQKSIDAIFETGRLLNAAKAALPHGSFTAMIASELPFGERAAQMLMKVAADERLTNAKHASVLPHSWMTLYELTKLDTPTLERRIAEGTIRPDMQRRDVATGGARSIMASREQAKESLDFAPTPPFATRALLRDVLPHLGIDTADLGLIAEPACGEGHMSAVLLDHGHQVRATDIADYGRDGRHAPGWAGISDFLTSDQRADWIITNPPFGDLTLPFIKQALALADRGVALFLRQQMLEGIERYQELYAERPPTLYAQFAERVPLAMGRYDPFGSTATAYCWLVWVKDVAPQPVFWIPPGRRVAYLQPDDIERFTAHPVIASSRVLAPFKSSQQTDQIIADGYTSGVVDFAGICARIAAEAGQEATKQQVRKRAYQLNLSDPDRQRLAASENMTRLNAERAGTQ